VLDEGNSEQVELWHGVDCFVSRCFYNMLQSCTTL
jgi:hypothetical protein